MELQNFHLISYHDDLFSNLHSLVKTQLSYINRVYQIIFSLYGDFVLVQNIAFLEFNIQFNQFVQLHASGEGFMKAVDFAQLYSNALLEKLLEDQIVNAAEKLEAAIKYFELAIQDGQLGSKKSVTLLNATLTLIEETELTIIETLEHWLTKNKQNKLEN